jgi:hypothetical protein
MPNAAVACLDPDQERLCGGVPAPALVNSPTGRPSSQAYSRITAPVESVSAISLPSRS